MDELALANLIKREFSTVPFSGSWNIVLKKDYDQVIEARQVADYFSDKKWQDITVRSLRADYIGDASACLVFMTPQAFRFYLPAYLLICIDEYNEADVIYDSTITRLIKSTEPTEATKFDDRFVTMALGQKQAIAAFLLQMHLLHDNKDRVEECARRALDSYWSSFLAKDAGST